MRLKPKKKLGQHFLIDKNIQRKIILACQLNESDTVLEIGAGSGQITALIAPLVKRVYAVELDRELMALLQETVKESGNVECINQDILKFDFSGYFGQSPAPIKIIGNIPYYISTPLIEYFLRFKAQIGSMYLMVQKEYAERAHASCGSKVYGSFSCFLQYHCSIRKLFYISRNCFYPPPKVDSAFLQLDVRVVPPVAVNDEARLFKVIRTAFQQRRKTLRNSLKGVVSAGSLEEFFQASGIEPNARPEQLCLKDFARLACL